MQKIKIFIYLTFMIWVGYLSLIFHIYIYIHIYIDITTMTVVFLEYSSGMNDALGCHCIRIFRFFC